MASKDGGDSTLLGSADISVQSEYVNATYALKGWQRYLTDFDGSWVAFYRFMFPRYRAAFGTILEQYSVEMSRMDYERFMLPKHVYFLFATVTV